MRTIKSITAGLCFGLAAVFSTGPAQAVPVLFNISGSGTGTSISGTFEIDSMDINGDDGTDLISIFSITDADTGIIWDESDSTTVFSFFDAAAPASRSISFNIEDIPTNTSIFTNPAFPLAPNEGTYVIVGPAVFSVGSGSISQITEPSTTVLFGLGLAALGLARRRFSVPVPG